MKKKIAFLLAALMLLTLMMSCNAIPNEPDPAHGEHGLAHHTPQTHGHTIDVGTAEPRAAQKLEYVPVMAQTAKAVRLQEWTVTVTNLSMMVDHAANLVLGDEYTVHFALTDTAGDVVVPIVPKDAVMKEYEGTTTFSAVQSACFDLPKVAPGEYVLTAYVAASDGTRVSEYAQVVFTDIAEHEKQMGDLLWKTVRGDGGSLILIVEQPHEGELEI